MKKRWWNSLHTKIIAWSFVPTVIILSAVAWFTFYSYQKVLGDLALKQSGEVVKNKVDRANQAINNLLNSVIRPIALNLDRKFELPLEVRAQNILDGATNLDIFDGGVYFVDQRGIVFKTQPGRPGLIGQDWSDTPQFRYARDHPPGSAPLTEIMDIGAGEAPIACAVLPMHDPQVTFIGAGYYCLAIEPTGQSVLNKTLNSVSLGEHVYILDGNQRITFSTDPAQIGKDLSTEISIQQVLQSESKSIRYQNGAEDKVISYSPLFPVPDGRNLWSIVSEQSWSEIMQPSLPYRQLLYVLLALGVIVPVVVTTYGVRHITDPIQKLIHASEQVTAGQFKHQIEVKTGDEIETLADQFNLMSAELDESYSSLEKKVADRTRELATMNAILSVASRSLDIHEILEEALNITTEQMGFNAGAAYKIESEPASPVLVTQNSFGQTTAQDIVALGSITSQLVTSEPGITTFECKDLTEEKLRSELLKSGIQMLLYMPLSTKGRVLAMFILGKPSPSPLPLEQLALLSSISQQVSVAIENAHLYERAEQTAINAERSRLARELHDAVTQTLFSANLIADIIPRVWTRNPDEGMKNLEELRQLTRGALAEMRTLLLEMRPESLERADIKSLITQLADAFIGRIRIPVSLTIQGDSNLTHEVKLVFYRVAQEALNNIAKHSGARQVEVNLECQPGRMSLLIKDDGLGFDPATITPDHLGMAIMCERANSIGAKLEIDSRVGQGTCIELDWNVSAEK